MRKLLLIPILITAPLLIAEDSNASKETVKNFTSYTGRLTKNKVRMRAQPSLESPVIKELNKSDLLIVTGETDDFYSVLPPQGLKAYIFRTFVLDNTVEGQRVNVRIEPSVDGPIVAQLNTGDKVDGVVSPLNSKWLEISMPESARFFVAKEYLEKVGDASLLQQITKKRNDVNSLLESTYTNGQQEMSKPYPDIKLDNIIKNYNRIIEQQAEFPDQAARAKELLKVLQENYLQKKIAYLEAKAETKTETYIIQTIPQAGSNEQFALSKPVTTAKMAAWNDVEDALYRSWEKGRPGETLDRFYEDQLLEAKELKGVVEVYTKPVKNKPGDYVLVNKMTNGIIAYLYSNKVNLADKVDQEVTVKVSARPNNNFAFPAYFVIEAY